MSKEALDRAFTALADPTRRDVVTLLRARPRRAGDLAQALAVSPPALSRHLRLLRLNGLVEQTCLPDDGRVHVYRLRPEPFADLRGWLDQVESFWSSQLVAFKAHAEGGPSRRPARPRRRRGDR